METYHDCDPDRDGAGVPIRVEPRRYGGVVWAPIMFFWALLVSVCATQAFHSLIGTWFCGIVVGTTFVNLILPWFDR